ncbi:MAG: hypothetical protein M0Q91_16155 [Methanoregula sp.]|nr:hypothetical protein [Methanoregula sp.]
MGCIWKGRANLQEYCATCSNGSRTGCLLDAPAKPFIERAYKSPAEFPMGVA